MNTEASEVTVEETPQPSSEEVIQEAKPAYVDTPVLHTALTKTAVTVIRRRYEDGRPSDLLFAMSSPIPHPTSTRLYRFEEVLEIRAALDHVINSVVVSSTNSLNGAQPNKAEATPEPSPESDEQPS